MAFSIFLTAGQQTALRTNLLFRMSSFADLCHHELRATMPTRLGRRIFPRFSISICVGRRCTQAKKEKAT
ncbi:predicted protein [Micromonas commoda]|uniref:Uncharacterized protein n=1 Tax=Micromonas commoda (strain RCC299 / NOUM17 / CCMP2709) TaxID=296587 RepID=C1FED2_MICCC|nr:predicted protein [Micromonas commoda]ACO68546.1 predicted protein [Micromonas commoda]|eukprot:XP_002507288.1 predicted protein [Micromonas commoda]